MPDGETQELRPLVIEVTTPGNPEELKARSAYNDARGLPDAMPHKPCVIISSGPSADSAALWDRLKSDPQITTVAVNGALELCIHRDYAPTYWACCDPQDLTANFIPDDAPWQTKYLLASKCPPSLYERLESLRLPIETWRLDDYVVNDRLACPTAVSITLVTQSLMRFKGFTTFEHYGWDCCYLNGEHHVSQQAECSDKMQFEIQNEDGSVLDCFDSNSSWIAELRDSVVQAYNLKVMGYTVKVHGPGAVGALLRAKKLIA